MAATRVAVWATGGVGRLAIAAIAERDDLELVAVRVHDPAKAGRAAGELAGIAPLGVAASDDPADLLAARPECVCYAAIGAGRDDAVVDDIVGLLEAGIDVVTVSLPGMVHPPAFDARLRDRLADAAARGLATFYASGIEPGFCADQLPLTLLTLSQRVRSVRTQEIFRYDEYPNTFTIFDVFGFGRPPEQTCLMEIPGVEPLRRTFAND